MCEAEQLKFSLVILDEFPACFRRLARYHGQLLKATMATRVAYDIVMAIVMASNIQCDRGIAIEGSIPDVDVRSSCVSSEI